MLLGLLQGVSADTDVKSSVFNLIWPHLRLSKTCERCNTMQNFSSLYRQTVQGRYALYRMDCLTHHEIGHTWGWPSTSLSLTVHHSTRQYSSQTSEQNTCMKQSMQNLHVQSDKTLISYHIAHSAPL